MTLSIGFSCVIYQISSHELARQVPSQSLFEHHGFDGLYYSPDFNQFFQDRLDEGRGELLSRLILLNITVLFLGSALSYYLARRTLTPIENAMASQSRFVTDASHELRTPLASMLVTNDVALRKSKISLPEAKEVIRSNAEDIQHLRELTDGLLSLATQDNSNIKADEVSLQAIVTEAINRVLPAAQAKAISIEDNIADIKVTGDKQRLEQVMVILLDNAIKFSSKKGKIEILSNSKSKRVLLSIKDYGEGIKSKDLPYIFDRFYRADSSRNKPDAGGYGIGLAIAQQIVERHDGRISVKSKPGHGTTFTVELPAS
ncbi:MAG TPA: HAMP domain-containing sensor histidine kinase [Candidatus Saccharimonadales bacterium]|nr:HAMP domain-containing sensor histidine kinase [Candidatus Saccharimonadales bacterium]